MYVSQVRLKHVEEDTCYEMRSEAATTSIMTIIIGLVTNTTKARTKLFGLPESVGEGVDTASQEVADFQPFSIMSCFPVCLSLRTGDFILSWMI